MNLPVKYKHQQPPWIINSGLTDRSQPLAPDAADNLTFDGRYEYAYDAWHRLVAVTRAWEGGVRMMVVLLAEMAWLSIPGAPYLIIGVMPP